MLSPFLCCFHIVWPRRANIRLGSKQAFFPAAGDPLLFVHLAGPGQGQSLGGHVLGDGGASGVDWYFFLPS